MKNLIKTKVDNLDKKRRIIYYEDKLKVAESLGYYSVHGALYSLYGKMKNKELADKFEVSFEGIRYILIKINEEYPGLITFRKRGGRNYQKHSKKTIICIKNALINLEKRGRLKIGTFKKISDIKGVSCPVISMVHNNRIWKDV